MEWSLWKQWYRRHCSRVVFVEGNVSPGRPKLAGNTKPCLIIRAKGDALFKEHWHATFVTLFPSPVRPFVIVSKLVGVVVISKTCSRLLASDWSYHRSHLMAMPRRGVTTGTRKWTAENRLSLFELAQVFQAEQCFRQLDTFGYR